MEKGLQNSDNGLAEEVDGNETAMTTAASNGGFSTKSESHINITQEMDRCDLWKHMVHNFEKEPSSCVTKSDSKKKENGLNGGVKCRANANETEMLLDSEPVLTSHKSLLYQSTEV